MENAVVLKITLPKIPDIEMVALEGLERLALHLGISTEKIGEVKILVTESITNALEHAGDANPSVRVEFRMTPKELVIYVRDFGKGFEPSEVEDPDLQSKLGPNKRKRGWGLKLMKELSDDFQIESGRNGTKITLKKLFS